MGELVEERQRESKKSATSLLIWGVATASEATGKSVRVQWRRERLTRGGAIVAISVERESGEWGFRG